MDEWHAGPVRARLRRHDGGGDRHQRITVTRLPEAKYIGGDLAARLQGQKIAILAADGVERVEFEQPRHALHEAGATTELLSISEGEIQAPDNDLDRTFPVDGLVSSSAPCPSTITAHCCCPAEPSTPTSCDWVEGRSGSSGNSFVETGKPMAAICDGPWTLSECRKPV